MNHPRILISAISAVAIAAAMALVPRADVPPAPRVALTPTPTQPVSPLPTPWPVPWWTWPCNTRPVHHPDGCPSFTPVEQPGRLLPAPCVRTTYTETVEGEEYVDYRLVIRVDHPEYDNVPALPVYVLHLRDGGWIADRDAVQFWDFDCGKDEAPLTWVAWKVLDSGALAPISSAYATPLPTPLLDLLARLANASSVGYNTTRARLIYLPAILR